MITKDQFYYQELFSVPDTLKGPCERGIPLVDYLEASAIRSNSESLREFEKRLGLAYESKIMKGNLCFASNPEVRLEFRTSFDQLHVRDYVYSIVHSQAYFHVWGKKKTRDTLILPYPMALDRFWKLVKIGREIRQYYIENPLLDEKDHFPSELAALANKVDKMDLF